VLSLFSQSTMNKIIQGRKIRIGIVGCGRIARNHFAAVETHSDNLERVDPRRPSGLHRKQAGTAARHRVNLITEPPLVARRAESRRSGQSV
jgi:hypothetical protein